MLDKPERDDWRELFFLSLPTNDMAIDDISKFHVASLSLGEGGTVDGWKVFIIL